MINCAEFIKLILTNPSMVPTDKKLEVVLHAAECLKCDVFVTNMAPENPTEEEIERANKFSEKLMKELNMYLNFKQN